MRHLLPFLLGVAAVPGFAPIAWFPLPVVSLAVLFWLLRDASPRQAFVSGWSYGLGLFLAGVSWIYVSLATYGGMPPALAVFATVLFCAFIALYPALGMGLAARHFSAGARLLALPGAWALQEWLRGWLFTGFPWLGLGYSQVPVSPLAGYAPLFGAYGVGFLVALSAAGLASLPGATGRRRGLMLVLLVGLWAGGLVLKSIEWTRPVGDPVSVSLVQGNVAQEMKFRPDRLQTTLNDYAGAILASPARLVILPETAIPVLRSRLSPDYLAVLGEHARRKGADILFGVPESEADGRYYNSVVSLGASPEGRYRKAHLVPFGEYFPPGFSWVLQVLSIPLSDFSAGAWDQPAIASGGEKLAVNICYEDVFGEERIAAARASTLLVNVSNDAWFGASFAPEQHLQIGAMRSLEAGRWQLRANNTGITAILDQHGIEHARVPAFTQATLNGEAQGREGMTPYLHWGNWPTLAAIFLLLGFAWWRRAN